MLPILRTISVGGVLLAITILGLALIPPGRPPMQQFAADEPTARGALIDRRAHPEWRQFLIHAALRRADELDRLRDLPDKPDGAIDAPTDATTASSTVQKLAGLPVAHDDAELEGETGAVGVAPSATIPIDIGATSSSELPVAPVDEKPPVARSPVVSAMGNDAPVNEAPATAAHADANEPPLSRLSALAQGEQVKPVVIIRKRSVRRPAAKPRAAAQTESAIPPPFNLLQAFFASLARQQSAAAEQPAKPAIARRPRPQPKQTAGIR